MPPPLINFHAACVPTTPSPMGSQRSTSSRRGHTADSSQSTERGLTGKADLVRASPRVLHLGVVLALAAEADSLAADLSDGVVVYSSDSEVEDFPAASDQDANTANTAGGERFAVGNYGKLASGKRPSSSTGSSAGPRGFTSWSESGGLREGAFKKKPARVPAASFG